MKSLNDLLSQYQREQGLADIVPARLEKDALKSKILADKLARGLPIASIAPDESDNACADCHGARYDQHGYECTRCLGRGTEPQCLICKDLGSVGYIVPQGDERFGKLYPCTNPECPTTQANAVKRAERRMARYNKVPELYAAYTLETWDSGVIEAKKKGKMLARYATELFCQHIETRSGKWSLGRALTHAGDADFANGDPSLDTLPNGADNPAWYDRFRFRHDSTKVYRDSVGNGLVLASAEKGTSKTGLMVAAYNRLRASHHAVAFIHFPTYINDLYRAIEQSKLDPEERDNSLPTRADLLNMLEADVLFLDECGLEKASDYVVSLVADLIITPRFTKNLPLFMTTNHTAKSFLDQWGGLAAYRVFEMCHWIELSGLVIRDRNNPIQA